MNSAKTIQVNFKKLTEKIKTEPNQKFVYNLIILDESGSMESIKTEIISGFNEVKMSIKSLEKKFPGQKHFVTFVTFNSLGIKTCLDVQPVKKIFKIQESSYKPDSTTPLYDAIGISIVKLKEHIKNKKESNVLVTILTDGLENSSVEYSGKQIKQMIDDLKTKNWVFTYIGTGHEIEKVASVISINNTLQFDRDTESMKGMFIAEQRVRNEYCKSINSK